MVQWFITGGVRSGKSAFAEKCVQHFAQKLHKQKVYVASGVPFDNEMHERILRHQRDRQNKEWITIERSVDFSTLCNEIPEQSVVLWDCVTTWLTNELYEGFEQGIAGVQNRQQFELRIEAGKQFIQQMASRNIPLIIVSNEVLDEWVEPNEETELYRQTIGQFHQWLVQQVDVAIEMDYGQPFIWKGGHEVENILP